MYKIGALWMKEHEHIQYYEGFIKVEGIEYPIKLINNRHWDDQKQDHRPYFNVYISKDEEKKING
jgi:hypothetical protein